VPAPTWRANAADTHTHTRSRPMPRGRPTRSNGRSQVRRRSRAHLPHPRARAVRAPGASRGSGHAAGPGSSRAAVSSVPEQRPERASRAAQPWRTRRGPRAQAYARAPRPAPLLWRSRHPSRCGFAPRPRWLGGRRLGCAAIDRPYCAIGRR
jgi:hypothetical protein